MTDTAYSDRLHIIVPVAWQAGARRVAERVDPTGGADAFSALLSPTGARPATHCWTSWQLRPEERAQLTDPGALVTTSLWRVYDGRFTTPDQALTDSGLRRVSTTTD